MVDSQPAVNETVLVETADAQPVAEAVVSPSVLRLQELLNEEKWTRATLANYTIGNLKELDILVDSAVREKAEEQLRIISEEHLVHTRTSIIALYVTGIVKLVRQTIDDSEMTQLLDIFADSRRWNLVEFICSRILDYGENRTALRRLSEVYEAENDQTRKFQVWERLIRVDYEEADIVKLLAENKESLGKHEESIDLYKKALHRYINKALSSNVKEMWSKLAETCPQDIDFFLHVQRKIAKQFSPEKAATLLNELYKYYKHANVWNTALDILKIIISYDDKPPLLRKEVIECYRGKFAGHSLLDDYIRMSNLAQSYRNLSEAIADFEKHIAFDKGNFVFHRTWNVGRISEIKGDEIVIDFVKSRGHKMSLKMAIDSLTSLSRDHIWVLKAVWSKEKLREKVKADPVWTLKTIIKSFDNRADLKKIKAELVPSILTPGEWSSWSSKARESIKSDPLFGNAQDDIDTFIVRDRPLSREEKIYNQFKAERNFFPRVQYVRDFLDVAEPDSEFFAELVSFFAGRVKTFQQKLQDDPALPSQKPNEEIIAAYLFMKEIAGAFPHLTGITGLSFVELFSQIPDPVAIYEALKDTRLKKEFLLSIRSFIPEWAEEYVKLFPRCLAPEILEHIESTGRIDMLKNLVKTIDDNYRDYREAFIWIIKNLKDREWFVDIDMPRDKILIKLVHILDISFKEIENHRDTTENRKINRQIQTMLFKDGELDVYLSAASRDSIERLFFLLNEVKDLDPSIKMKVRKEIGLRFENFRFGDEEERTTVSRGLMVTRVKLEEKSRLLQKIMEEDVPANQKEIAFALSLGDLRENAEYKAAKEKQEELNAKVGKIKNELERAQIFDPSTISTSRISFGTVITLFNVEKQHTEVYTILGPWESEPSVNIISYLSPLGKNLINHKVGEELKFDIHTRPFHYVIKDIKPADI